MARLDRFVSLALHRTALGLAIAGCALFGAVAQAALHPSPTGIGAGPTESAKAPTQPLGNQPLSHPAPAAQPPADRFQFGNLLYTAPAGWSRSTFPDHVRLTVDDHDTWGYVSIEIRRGEPKPADVRAWLEKRLNSCLPEGEQPTRPPQLQRSTDGPHPVWFASQFVDGDLQIHTAIELPDRVEHLFFKGPLEERSANAAQRFFTPLCSGLGFISTGSAPLLGAPVAGELNGAYYALTTGYGFGGVELDHRLMVFWPNGRFFEGFPVGASPSSLDLKAELDLRPNQAGNYRVRGKRLELNYADGSRERLPFLRFENQHLSIDELDYRPVPALADGRRFDGFYRLSNYTSFSAGSGVVGGAGGSRSLKLTKSGRFEAEALNFAFGNFENSSGDTTGGFAQRAAPTRQVGRYRVENGLLWLEGDDGSRVARSLFEIEPGLIFIDGEPLVLEEK